mmetsp:Transcript_1234/g.1969  ORF Transcript_1234/g.1969 Transcript_1234/m.1969 type:complete len:243 (-) Transcript_1234:1438-2166(-)
MAHSALKGFDKSRFVSALNDHFTCKVCQNVVRHPVECTECENLTCKDCLQSACPYECSSFVPKKPAKFAQIFYSSLKLKCANSSSGCEFVGTCEEIEFHEPTCMYVYLKCASPICSQQFLKAQRIKLRKNEMLCSDLCEHTYNFYSTLESGSLEVLQKFSTEVTLAKQIIDVQVMKELGAKASFIQEKKKEIKRHQSELEARKDELKARKEKFHPGRWNTHSLMWSCCGRPNKYSVGCRVIF